jgi:hypothetical protein
MGGMLHARAVAERSRRWHDPGMRRRSVADELARAEQERIASLSPGERVALALELGERSLADYAAAHGIGREAARKEFERERQAGRRPSGCIEALLE